MIPISEAGTRGRMSVSGKRVLLIGVDSLPLIRTLGTAYTVDIAPDAEVGCDMIATRDYALVIASIERPARCASLCVSLRTRQRHLPVVALIRSDDPIDRATCLDGGADDCVSRPCYISELAARVHAMVRRLST